MSIKQKIFVVIASIILVGCTNSPAVATSEKLIESSPSTQIIPTPTPCPVCTDEPEIKPGNVATLEFSTLPIEPESGLNYTIPQIEEEGLTFSVRGIYAINTDIAFIFGGLDLTTGTIRSLILRTTDGGNHWKEVMIPTYQNDITHVVFIDNGEGWAVATWTLEGESSPKLWHTTDYGETWQENKDYISGINGVGGIRIFDSNHIQIKSLYWWANPYTDRYIILDSYDGGISWNESFSTPVDNTNYAAVIEAYADKPGGQYGNYYPCNMRKRESTCIAYGQDGSKWQSQNIYRKVCIDSYQFDKLQFVEISHTWLEQETSYSIPIYFIYQDNQVIVKP